MNFEDFVTKSLPARV